MEEMGDTDVEGEIPVSCGDSRNVPLEEVVREVLALSKIGGGGLVVLNEVETTCECGFSRFLRGTSQVTGRWLRIFRYLMCDQVANT